MRKNSIKNCREIKRFKRSQKALKDLDACKKSKNEIQIKLIEKIRKKKYPAKDKKLFKSARSEKQGWVRL